MRRMFSWMQSPRFRQACSHHREIILGTFGLFLIWLIPTLLSHQTDGWVVATFTASAVALGHSMLTWLIRRHERQIRHQTIREIQQMLEDRVKNKLAILQLHITEVPDRSAFELTAAREAIDEIVQLIDLLDENSLTAWQSHYRKSLTNRDCAHAHPGPSVA